MEKSNKLICKLIILGLILLASIIFLITLTSITGETVRDDYTYTKAICNENNFCQDYIIACQNKELTSMDPITGATIQHSNNWEDPRDKEVIETFCE